MTRFPKGVLCERARTWAALAPDGELSELERKLLEAHLDRCAACSTFAVHVGAIARALREAPPEPLPYPVAVPRTWRRQPVYARVRSVSAVAAVALMALGIASRAPLPTSERESFALPRVTNFSTNLEREAEQFRALRRAAAAPTSNDAPHSNKHLAI